MKALVYGGPGQKSWTDVPDPHVIHPTDAIVRIDTTTIYGTDLHILKGDVPTVQEGRVLGHEGVGTVIEVGSSVTGLRTGDRVVNSWRFRHCKFPARRHPSVRVKRPARMKLRTPMLDSRQPGA